MGSFELTRNGNWQVKHCIPQKPMRGKQKKKCFQYQTYYLKHAIDQLERPKQKKNKKKKQPLVYFTPTQHQIILAAVVSQTLMGGRVKHTKLPLCILCAFVLMVQEQKPNYSSKRKKKEQTKKKKPN